MRLLPVTPETEPRARRSAPGHRRAGRWFSLAAAACAILVTTFPAFGQATQTGNEKLRPGSIHGTLTTTQDEASTGLAGLTVRLTPEPSLGRPLTADTDDRGRYEFNNLTPGNYTISISQPGFKPFRKSISLSAGQAGVLDIRVELETVAEKVEVSEETQAVATETVSAPTETVTQRELVA